MTRHGGWIQEPEPLPNAEWVWLDDPNYPGWIIPREVTAEIYRRWLDSRTATA